jgi:hypothetical protein
MPRKSRSKPFWTLDCETDPFKKGRIPQPFLWGVYDGDSGDYWTFNTAAEVCEFLDDKPVIVYAHNGGKFDYHYMREFINSDEPITVINGRLAKFKIGVCEFRDSFNILVNPLSAFCKEDIDYTKLEAHCRAEHMNEIRAYLRSDCINLWDTIKAYFGEYGRSLTQAGAAMKHWQDKFYVPMTPQSAHQAERYRDFYYGGRVQCFVKGVKRAAFEVLDINSAYPHAMLQRHPLSPEGAIGRTLPKAERLGACMVRLTAVAKGCFPLRAIDNGLYFPDDCKTTREYFVSGWELIAALETNSVRVIKILEVHEFSQTVNFIDYITHFYEKRKTAKAAGDKAADIFAKLFMNSLYGKFAADPEKYGEYVIATDDSLDYWSYPPDGDTADPYQRVQLWGERHLMGRSLPESKHRYYNVATASSITGYVRAQLWRAICKSGAALYCDTDSIAAGSTQGIARGPDLGEWKLELDCDQYAIGGKKLYAFHNSDKAAIGTKEEWKFASKGVRLTPAEIFTVARGGTVDYRPEVPTYSIMRPEPVFTSREVKSTFRNSKKMPIAKTRK